MVFAMLAGAIELVRVLLEQDGAGVGVDQDGVRAQWSENSAWSGRGRVSPQGRRGQPRARA